MDCTTFGKYSLLSIAHCDALCFAGTSDEIMLALVGIKGLLQIHSVLQLDRVIYTEGKITCKNDPLAQLFSESVKAEYGALQDNKCWCLLTNATLSFSTVIGFHLFKWEWSEYVHLPGFEDINDIKIGLPWCNGHTVNTWLTPSLLGLRHQSTLDLRFSNSITGRKCVEIALRCAA